MNEHIAKARRYHVPSKEREYFTSSLAMLLKSGVTVSDALSALKATTKSRPLQRALNQMQRDIDEGFVVAQALERSGIVSDQTIALAKLGEQSGNLSENLQVAAAQEQKQRIFRSKVQTALLYPAFVLGITSVVGLGIAWFLLPRLADTFQSLQVDLPLITKIFIDFGEFLRDNGLWFVPVMSAVLLGFVYVLFAAPKTREIGRRVLMHMPGISRLMKEVEIARFGYLMGTMLESGLGIIDSFKLLSEATSSPAYKSFYMRLLTAFEEGYSFSESFRREKRSTALLPPAVQQMVIAGEKSGSLPQSLRNISDVYEQKADSTAKSLEIILEPILLLIVWAGVVGVAVAVIVPIYSLVGGLGV